jgi:hypothetical protein
MNLKFIIYNPKTNLFDFFIEALLFELEEKKIEYEYYNNLTNFNYKNDIFFIIINPHFIFDYKDIYNELLNIKKKFKHKILYITEPINFLIEKKVYTDIINLIQPFCLWTYTYENFNKLNLYQKIFKIFPINKKLFFCENITIEKLKKKNIDKLIFFGNINNNRKDICDKLFNEDLLINFTDKWSKEEWTEILESNLCYINVHRRIGCKSFESFRIIPILANGGIVFSEKFNEKEEEFYKDFNIIFFEKKELINIFKNFIKNINYEDILNKTNNFKKIANNFNEIDDFFYYYNNFL